MTTTKRLYSDLELYIELKLLLREIKEKLSDKEATTHLQKLTKMTINKKN